MTETSIDEMREFVETIRRVTPLLEVTDDRSFRIGETAGAALTATMSSVERSTAMALATHYLGRTDPIRAAEYFLDSGRGADAAAALERLPIEEWFSQSPTERHALLERLEDEAFRSHPNLVVARSAALTAWFGRHQDGLELLDSTSEWTVEPNRAGWGEYVRARALIALGRSDDACRARDALQQYVERARHVAGATVSSVVRLLCRQAIVEHLLGEPTAARTIDLGLDLCETTNDDTREERILLHHTRGFIAHRIGDLKAADRHIRAAIHFASSASSAAERASLYHIQSAILRGRGELSRSVAVLERGLREPSLPPREQGLLTLQMAHSLADLEDFRGAVRRYRSAAMLLRPIDRDGMYPRALAGMAVSYAQLGFLHESEAALGQFDQHSRTSEPFDWHLAFGVHRLCAGNFSLAADAFETAARRRGTPGGVRDQWQAFLLKAQAHVGDGETTLARAAIAEGLALFPDGPVPCVGLWVFRPIAELLGDFAMADSKNGLTEVLRTAGLGVAATNIRHLVSRVADLSTGYLPDERRAAVSVEIRLLGAPMILVDGREIGWPYGFRHKAIEAFWYVASRHDAVSPGRLAADLFPDGDEETALRTTKVALSELRGFLRKLLGVPGETILTRGIEGRVAFCPDAIPGTCRIDLDDLARLADDLKRRNPSEACEASLGIFRGEFLAGTDAEWLQSKRRYWTSLSIRLLGTLARRAEENGYLERAVDCYQRMVVLDPTLEAPHAALMKLFHAAGDVQARDSQMWLYSRICKDELDAEPSQLVQRLYQGLNQTDLGSVG